MAELMLYVFGPPRLERNSNSVDLGLRKAQALIVYLAVTAQPHSRDHLATLLWPDGDQREARARLRRTLHRLGEAVGGDILEADGDSVRLRSGLDLWLDCAVFREEVTSGLPASPTHVLAPARLAHLTRAVDLYVSPFLDGFTLPDSPAFDEWQFFQRESLHQLYGQALEQLVHAYQRGGDIMAAIPYARRWVALDRLHEPAQRALMRLYAASGQVTAAIRQYQECVRVLDEELGVEPEAETTELYNDIRARRIEPDVRAAAAESPGPAIDAGPGVLQSGTPTPTIHSAFAYAATSYSAERERTARILASFPANLSPCIGRTAELTELQRLLAEPAHRLITLTGPGGIGKTRLAIEAGINAQPDFPHGACFVDLTTAKQAQYIFTMIAATIGLAAQSDQPIAPRVHAYLRDRRMLLILDNLEHLQDMTKVLDALLANGPLLTILATSHEPLGLAAERVIEIRGVAYPLDPPEQSRDAHPEVLAGYGAIQLFVARARQIEHGFVPSDADLQAIARLCRLVGGMPLAIEIAASWVRLLSCSDIADEIAHNLDFLTAKQRDTPERHRSIRAVFEQSWRRLPANEQTILRRLALFQGGFSREAAAAVGGATLPELAALLDRQLLYRAADQRYQLHELIRQFASERLRNMPEEYGHVEQSYADYFMSVLAQLTPALQGEQPGASLDQIDALIADIRAAWRLQIAREKLDALGRGGRALWLYYAARGSHSEGEALFREAAEACADAIDHAGLKGFLLVAQGYCITRQGRMPEGRVLLDQGMSMLRRAEPRDLRHETFALMWCAYLALFQGRPADAEALSQESALFCQTIGDRWTLAMCLLIGGASAYAVGRVRDAIQYYRKCLAESQAARAVTIAAFVQQHLARVAIVLGEYSQGIAWIDEAERLFAATGDHYGAAAVFRERAIILHIMGDYAQAARLLTIGQQFLRNLGCEWDAQKLHTLLGHALRLQERFDAAVREFEHGFAAASAAQHPVEMALALTGLGRVAIERGDYDVAEQHLQEALALWEQVGNQSGIAASALYLGQIAARHPERYDEARRSFLRALDIVIARDVPAATLECIAHIAPLLTHMHQSDETAAMMQLVAEHPASTAETRALARSYLQTLGAGQTRAHPFASDMRAVTEYLASHVRDSLNTEPSSGATQSPDFVGRRHELNLIGQFLQGKSSGRLLTLTGPGGIGKTRLATEAIANAVIFTDGVEIIEFAPLSDPDLAPQAVADALGVAESSEHSMTTALIRHLSDKHLLLALDNCEHVIDACAHLAEALLRACPQLYLLATSREPLGINAEIILPVPSLSLPATDHLLSLEALARNDAVRLFAARARAVQPNFVIDSNNIAAIIQICRRLDGIPLAIELAAARVRLMRVEQIAARLGDRFQLLSGGMRTALPRHKTLEALIGWSYDLLLEPERDLLRRLAVFAGGWILEAAELVGGDDALELLGLLVNKSLVIVDYQENGDPRYRMLETIRQYALAKLQETGDEPSARRQHLEYVRTLVVQAAPELRGPAQVFWLDRLEAEHGNIRAALEWSLATDVTTTLTLTAELVWFWHIRGRKREGRDWLKRALAHEPRDTNPPDAMAARAHAFSVAGFLAHMQGDFEQATLLLNQGINLVREHLPAHRQLLAATLIRLSGVILERGEFDLNRALLEEALNLCRDLGDNFGMAECFGGLGRAALIAGDYEQAHLYWKERLTLREALGDQDGIADARAQLGTVAFWQGDRDSARSLMEQSLTDFRAINNRWAIGFTLVAMAEIAHAAGDYAAAERCLSEAVMLGKELGDTNIVAHAWFELGGVARSQGNYTLAARLYEDALDLMRELGNTIAIAAVCCALGHVACETGDYVTAEGWFDETLAIGRAASYTITMSAALAGFSKISRVRGDHERAAALALDALERRRSAGSHWRIWRREVADRWSLPLFVEAVALAYTVRRNWNQAARLFGATEEWHLSLLPTRSPAECEIRAAAITTIREALGHDAANDLMNAGQALSFESMIAAALHTNECEAVQ